ncbi:NACHT, LRR and PYD domains-containing protein 1 homolog [Labeo rohita]|uniref:NACHT, LRR and PYD domains-containing protein 1 homolog n=1 Tax=Labeo rohita TaxID=84645 RepID=UPI0021E22EBB|nr:NACHT, LRR and PYD domains-containing protein 1 homolog [Labeo rohita]
MFRSCCCRFCNNKDLSRSHNELNVNTTAESGSHITAPLLTNNTITGNVHIIHNAPGFTGYHTQSEKEQTSEISSVILKYKKQICSEYQYVTEYNSLPGEQVLLSERFTQPLILQTHRDQQEREEEICSSGEDFQQVLSSRSSHESIHLNSLFNPDKRGISYIAIILQGNCGNGKSFTVQKIMLDWASDKLYKGCFDIVFHLKCKEINRIPGKKNLAEILSYSCSLTSDEISQILQQSQEKVLFIIDGFDELKLTQDIYDMSAHTDPLQGAPPEVIFCALLKGQILPESFLLVTTRSTATDTLGKLLKGPHRFSEIMGFSEKGVEEYFQKFFQDEELFGKAYECVRANETLITACSIPVICWIICTVMRERFSDGADVTSGLETTTSIYVDFVSTLLEHHCQGLSQSVPTMLRSLGQLAERGMLEKQVLFDEESVNKIGLDPAANPFLCKFLFKKRICQETMFSFMHLSFQEFFTALYYISLDNKMFTGKLREMAYTFSSSYEVVHRFLFGLLNEDVRSTLKRKYGVSVHPDIENSLKKSLFQGRCVFFTLHCLYELHEESFVKEVLNAEKHIFISYTPLRRTDCWALLYCALCCERIKELTLYCCKLVSENLSIIQPVLHKFERITLTPESQPDSALINLIHVLTRGQTLKSLSARIEIAYSHSECRSISALDMSISEKLSRVKVYPQYGQFSEFSLTFLQSHLNNIDWTTLFRALQTDSKEVSMYYISSLSGLKKMELWVENLNESWAIQIISLIKNCPSLTEFLIYGGCIQEEGIKAFQKSHTRPDCALTYEGSKCRSDPWTTNYIHWNNCNERVQIQLHAGGFFIEPLRPLLFPN